MADLFTQTTIRSQARLIRSTLGLPEPGSKEAESEDQNPEVSLYGSQDDILAMLASGELSPEEAGAIL